MAELKPVTNVTTPLQNATATAAKPEGAPATFRIAVADRDGRLLGETPGQAADPSATAARQLVFDVDIALGGASPAVADLALYREISRIEHALLELYPADNAAAEARFRPMFVRLFYAAQLALQGDVKTEAGKVVSVGGRLSTDAAKAEVAAIAADLIDDEAPRVKARHLRALGRYAGWLSLPALLAYVMISLLVPAAGQGGLFEQTLLRLNVQPQTAANFMLLWVGTMVGVCLSYALRTTEFTVADLTKPDGHYLAPYLRLAITGALAVLLVLFAMIGLGDVSVGTMSLKSVAAEPMLALVIGAILGIGEQTLSGTVAKKAGDLFGGVK